MGLVVAHFRERLLDGVVLLAGGLPHIFRGEKVDCGDHRADGDVEPDTLFDP